MHANPRTPRRPAKRRLPRRAAVGRLWPLAPILAALLGLAAMPAWARAQEPAAPKECSLGIYLLSVHDLDTGADRFSADFWIWTVCPDSERNPFESLEFANADELEITNAYTRPSEGGQYSGERISGVFRQDWDVRRFPFDTHRLDIRIEEAEFETADFRFVPDNDGTGAAEDASPSGWTISSLDVEASATGYRTNFGDPSLAADTSSEYSRIDVVVTIGRAELSTFFQMTAIVYAAIVLALLTYVLSIDLPDSLDPQFSIIGAALFGISINLLATSSVLGQQNGLTLIDAIHLVALACLAAMALAAIASRVAYERGVEKQTIFRWNMVALAVTAAVFVLANVALVAGVAGSG